MALPGCLCQGKSWQRDAEDGDIHGRNTKVKAISGLSKKCVSQFHVVLVVWKLSLWLVKLKKKKSNARGGKSVQNWFPHWGEWGRWQERGRNTWWGEEVMGGSWGRRKLRVALLVLVLLHRKGGRLQTPCIAALWSTVSSLQLCSEEHVSTGFISTANAQAVISVLSSDDVQ